MGPLKAIPERMLERARSLARGDGAWTAPPLRSASTVVLLRDGESGLQTYLMRRARTMAFAPGMYVFPGGRLDEVDIDAGAAFASDVFPFTDAERAGTDEVEMRALVACAVRELEEEASVRLSLTPGSLALIDHWVTPEEESHRYDVRFFAARLPDDQVAAPRGTEADLVSWMSPTDALAAYRAGQLALLPPTLAVLEFLSGHQSAASVLRAGAERDLAPRMPRALLQDDGSLDWVIVNERTGEILQRRLGPPEASEVSGAMPSIT